MSENGEGADPKDKLVLVVDDDEHLRNLMEVIVGAEGFQVVTASTGEEAITKLPLKPDAMLLDLIMPGCGGLGVLKHLRTIKDRVPAVIAVTAYENRHPTVVEAVMDPNVMQCLAKPFSHEVLTTALHRYLKTSPRPASAPAVIKDSPTPGVSPELQGNQFFKGFREDSKAKLSAMAQTETYPDSSQLFNEGDSSDWVFLVCEGKVEMVKKTEGDKQVVLTTVETGDYFGEIGILEKSVRQTGARAVGNVTVKKISCEEVHNVLKAEPADVALWLLRRVLQYLRQTTERYMGEIIHKEKRQLIGEMASSIIHDFKNPLSGIQLAAEAVKIKHNDPKTSGLCDTIVNQTQRMVGMAQELLEFSRGDTHLNLEKMPVNELFEKFRSLNEEYLKRSKVTLDIKPVETRVAVDPERFLRVLQNLVGNAVDALGSQPNGAIGLSAKSDSGRVEISVQDNGPGIPETIRGRIFEPFFTYGKKRGTGLGMPIAKSLVEAHGGTLSFASDVGKGTTFRISLPSAN